MISRISDPELQKWARENWSELKTLLTEIIHTFNGQSLTIEFNDNDCTINLMGGEVTIAPAIYERRSIRGIVERPGWGISVWQWFPGDREQMDDCFPVEDEVVDSSLSAAITATYLSLKLIVTRWGQSKCETALAKEMTTVVPDGEVEC